VTFIQKYAGQVLLFMVILATGMVGIAVWVLNVTGDEDPFPPASSPGISKLGEPVTPSRPVTVTNRPTHPGTPDRRVPRSTAPHKPRTKAPSVMPQPSLPLPVSSSTLPPPIKGVPDLSSSSPVADPTPTIVYETQEPAKGVPALDAPAE
jgi:hypothetical protein